MLVPEVKVESKKYGFNKIDLRFCAIVEIGVVIKWGYETRFNVPGLDVVGIMHS
jgi:hypothetical protein